MGEKFSRSLLTPIQPHALFTLLQSGWDAKFILRVCLSAINDMHNSSGRRTTGTRANEEFTELLEALAKIQQAGGLGARLVKRDGEQSILFFRRNLGEDVERNVQVVNRLLGLNPDKKEYRMV